MPAHLQLSHPKGLAPIALAELVPGWMMVPKSSKAGSGQMAGFKPETCIELPRCQLAACIPPRLAATLLVHAAVLQCSMC